MFDVSSKIYESMLYIQFIDDAGFPVVTHLVGCVTNGYITFHISLEILCFPVHPPCRGPRTGTPAPVHWTAPLTVQLLLGEARAWRYRRLAITPAPATHPNLGKR